MKRSEHACWTAGAVTTCFSSTRRYNGNKGPWITDGDLEGVVDRSRSVHVAGAGGAHLALMDEQMDAEEMASAADVSDVFHDIMRRLTPGDRLCVLATEGAMYAVRQELKYMGLL